MRGREDTKTSSLSPRNCRPKPPSAAVWARNRRERGQLRTPPPRPAQRTHEDAVGGRPRRGTEPARRPPRSARACPRRRPSSPVIIGFYSPQAVTRKPHRVATLAVSMSELPVISNTHQCCDPAHEIGSERWFLREYLPPYASNPDVQGAGQNAAHAHADAGIGRDSLLPRRHSPLHAPPLAATRRFMRRAVGH